MSKWDNRYQVFDTPCFPARWKVGRFEDDDNATVNFFRDHGEALREAAKRNEAKARRDSAVDPVSI